MDPLRAQIEPFVRGELGCECPEEVFSDIQVLEKPAAWLGLPIDYALEIGGRLLVVVCLRERWHEVSRHLPELIHTGVQARDQRSLNRFRLVVPTTDRDAALEVLQSRFSALAGTDEKVHLHVVGLARLPAVAGSR